MAIFTHLTRRDKAMTGLTTALAAALAASITTTFMDANPTLYLHDKIFVTDHHLHRTFNNRRIWIIGASSGIGAELSTQLARYGAKSILSGRRKDKLVQVANGCCYHSSDEDRKEKKIATGGEKEEEGEVTTAQKPVILPLDITSSDSIITKTVARAIRTYGGVDVLILNSGGGHLSTAMNTSPRTTRQMMNVNYFGHVRLALAVMKQDHWKERSKGRNNGMGGHIVVTSSVAGKMAVPLTASYAASKHALMGYFTSLRSECSKWLRVDLPCPGPVQTEFHTSSVKHVTAKGEKAIAGVGNTRTRNASTEPHDNDDDDHGGGGETGKMFAKRCARLIISGMAGPTFLFHETWISKQPTLTFSFLSQYCPSISTRVMGWIGPLRVKAYEAGLPLYKASSWMKAARIPDG